MQIPIVGYCLLVTVQSKINERDIHLVDETFYLILVGVNNVSILKSEDGIVDRLPCLHELLLQEKLMNSADATRDDWVSDHFEVPEGRHPDG